MIDRNVPAAAPSNRPSRRVPGVSALLALGACAAAVLPPLVARAAYPAPVSGRRFAVSTDNADASHAALEVLRGGGNAVDAAIAAALAVGVTDPESSGFGGGGFATYCNPQGVCTFFDFRETSPAALTVESFAHAPDPAHASQTGGLAVGVPGEPQGFVEFSHRYGRLPLARTVAPVVALARRGFEAPRHVAYAANESRELIAHDPSLAALFLPGGSPIAFGTPVHRRTLANTLERYGREGERFVHGTYAASVERAVHAAGGVLTADDVRAYHAVERTPLARPFRGYTVVTAPPPSAGGLIVLESLAFIDPMSAAQLAPGSSSLDHALATAWRGAFDDRARYVTDPGSTSPAPPAYIDALLDPARIARRRAAFDPEHVTPVPVLPPAPRDHGTTHLCVVDADGGMVALTATVNLFFGARITAPDLDVVLNDEIDDFSLGTPGNNFNLAPSTPNALAPGHRPVSSMSPTVVLRDGHPVGCAGAAGGPRIATSTTQVLVGMLVHGLDPAAAVAAPRVHHQGAPDVLMVEREVPEDVRAGLRRRGYTLNEATPEGLASAQALFVRDRDGHREVFAGSDPRGGGAPAAE